MKTRTYEGIRHGDWVRCVLCGAQMLLPCGADKCPEKSNTYKNVNAEQSLSILIMVLRIACFGKHLKDWIWMLVMPHGFTSLAAATTASTIRGSTYASAGPAKELANVALTDHMIY